MTSDVSCVLREVCVIVFFVFLIAVVVVVKCLCYVFRCYPIGRRTVDSEHPVISDTFSLRIPLLSNTDTVNTSSSNPIGDALEFAMNMGEARDMDVLLEQDCVSERDDPCVQSVSERDDPCVQSVSERDDPCVQSVSERDDQCDRSVSEQDAHYDQSISEQDDPCDRGVSERDDQCDRSVNEEDEVDQQNSEQDDSDRESVSEQDDSDRESVNEEDEADRESVSEQDEMDLVDVEGYVSSDSGAGDINTPRGVPQTPAPDPHAFAEFNNFDYDVEMEDFENLREFDIDKPFDMNEFEQDLSTIVNMDFSKYIH